MAFRLPTLKSKADVDTAFKYSVDKVLVFRFGRESDPLCAELDETLAKTQRELSKMAEIYLVEVDSVPIYTQYFDITIIPATLFFFNTIHIKVDYGTPDHTKWIGSFKCKQDFIDLVEMIYRGAVRGKQMITSPISPLNVPKFQLLYKDF